MRNVFDAGTTQKMSEVMLHMPRYVVAVLTISKVMVKSGSTADARK